MNNKFLKWGVCAFAGIVLTGCSKLTVSNYDQLKMGMSQEDIERVIGEPDRCETVLGAVNCTWGNEDDTYINIKFVAGNAVMFSHQNLKD